MMLCRRRRLLGPAFICTVVIAFAILRSKKNLENLHEDVSATMESSAFPNELYHELQTSSQTHPCFPQRIHVSQASNIFESQDGQHPQVNMTVSISLDYQLCRDMAVAVTYGRGPVPEGRATVKPLHFNYTSARTGEYYESDLIYHVVLSGLRAGSHRYWYRIQVEKDSQSVAATRISRGLKGNSNYFEDEKEHVITSTVSFPTPPLNGSSTPIALIGDLGQTKDSTATMAHIYRATSRMNDNPISMIMIAGDQSYADGESSRWTNWLDIMEPLLRTVPVHVAAGNHEIECDNVTHIPFQFYENLFRNPNRIGPAEIDPISPEERNKLWNKDCTAPSEFLGHYNFGNSFYAVDHGLLHIITLNSYSDTSVGSIQYQWLEQHLKSIDRILRPWIVAVFHAPLYTTFVGHVDELEARTMKEAVEPLFVKYKVNLIFNGHDHAYMRTHPLAFGEVDKTGQAPVYLTIGSGGNREHHAPGYRNEKAEAWVAKRDRFEYGYGHLHVANDTHALWNWVRDGCTKEGMQDRVWFINPHAKS